MASRPAARRWPSGPRVEKALKREGHAAASHTALSRQAHRPPISGPPPSASAAAKKAARTKEAGRGARLGQEGGTHAGEFAMNGMNEERGNFERPALRLPPIESE